MNVSQAPTRLANTQFEKGKEHTHRTPKDEIDPCSNVREVLLPKSANRRSPRDSYYHQRKPGKHNKGARKQKTLKSLFVPPPTRAEYLDERRNKAEKELEEEETSSGAKGDLPRT